MSENLEISELDDGRVIDVTILGKLTDADYEQFVPLTERRIKQFGKIGMLIVLKDFGGWDLDAMWDDLKFDIKHFSDIERMAIVGHSKWDKFLSALSRPFTAAEIKYFDEHELTAARQWVANGQVH